jgi:MFS transporter, MHS family, proline/betaine transporter
LLGLLLGHSWEGIFTRTDLPSWGWRIPFIVGGVFGLGIFLLRRNLTETPAFEDIKSRGKIVKLPIISVLRKRPISILRGIGIGVNTVTPFYLAIIYMNSVLKERFLLESTEILAWNTGIIALWILLLPIAGYISDKIGKYKLMAISAAAALIVAYPAFLMAHNSTSIYTLLAFQVLVSVISSYFVGPCSAVLPELFPPEERYSGSAFSYSLGVAVLGGTAPLIVTSLVNQGIQMGPAIYLMFSSIVGFIAVYKVKSRKKEKMHSEMSYKKAA